MPPFFIGLPLSTSDPLVYVQRAFLVNFGVSFSVYHGCGENADLLKVLRILIIEESSCNTEVSNTEKIETQAT